MGVPALAVAAIAATAASAGISAYSAYQGGQTAKAQANYQSAVALRNAEAARENAAMVEATGARQIEQQARQTRQMMGAQRSAYAANGLLLDTGTTAEVLDDTAFFSGLSIEEIRMGAAREGRGYRTSAAGLEADAVMARSAGRAAAQAGFLTAGASLLSGAGRAGSQFADMRRTGVPNNNPPAVG